MYLSFLKTDNLITDCAFKFKYKDKHIKIEIKDIGWLKCYS